MSVPGNRSDPANQAELPRPRESRFEVSKIMTTQSDSVEISLGGHPGGAIGI